MEMSYEKEKMCIYYTAPNDGWNIIKNESRCKKERVLSYIIKVQSQYFFQADWRNL
jgi:hypothetical protein